MGYGQFTIITRSGLLGMRVLIISNLFPPFIMGGAEMAAHSLACWLTQQGHQVYVLTGAPGSHAEAISTEEGFQVERRFFPNLYSIYKPAKHSKWEKAVWHWSDHFHGTTEEICRDVIRRFKPDVVNTHDLQGIGYNILREIGRQSLPCVQVLHDFGFLCIKMTMFYHGNTCAPRHLSCMASGWVKRNYLSSIKRLSFWSPSKALLDYYLPHLPKHQEAECIRLPLFFTEPERTRNVRHDHPVKLLFVGQIVAWKGIEFLLEVLLQLAPAYEFKLTVVGDGKLLEHLQQKYTDAPWVSFTGKVPPNKIADIMSEHDVLVVPSLWFENSPLVVHQAIQMGIPILASSTGGLPELVMDQQNGRLLNTGDATQWKEVLAEMFSDYSKIQLLKDRALRLRPLANPDISGNKVVQLFERTISGEGLASTKSETFETLTLR